MDTVMRKTTKNSAGTPPAGMSQILVSPLAYGLEDAANAVGLSRSRIYELIAAGEIVPCKVGNRTIIPIAELAAFLDRHRADRAAGQEIAPAPPPPSGLEKKRQL
jgi:excisionase family DNA binding protein